MCHNCLISSSENKNRKPTPQLALHVACSFDFLSLALFICWLIFSFVLFRLNKTQLIVPHSFVSHSQTFNHWSGGACVSWVCLGRVFSPLHVINTAKFAQVTGEAAGARSLCLGIKIRSCTLSCRFKIIALLRSAVRCCFGNITIAQSRGRVAWIMFNCVWEIRARRVPKLDNQHVSRLRILGLLWVLCRFGNSLV